ncbi:hypothetical protein QP938_08660 [Porticoccaceae bacterium LTM1]|nr:hypothetical protein QP938_08660 [Porticoccaceae bacterium LTM1]
MKKSVMDNESLKTLAHLIVDQQFSENMKFYLMYGGLLLLVTFGGGWLASYVGTRGKLHALQVDQQKILRQLEATTRTTENIKAEIDHEFWWEKERVKLQRERLEQLVESVSAESVGLINMIAAAQNLEFRSTVEIESALRTSSICTLYFPTLKSSAEVYFEKVVKAHIAFRQMGRLFEARKSDIQKEVLTREEVQLRIDSSVEEVTKKRNEFVELVTQTNELGGALISKAASLMESLIPSS